MIEDVFFVSTLASGTSANLGRFFHQFDLFHLDFLVSNPERGRISRVFLARCASTV